MNDKAETSPKLEWPKELLDYLQRAGPFWSLLVGIVVLVLGFILKWVSLEGSGIAILIFAFLLLITRPYSRVVRPELFAGMRNLFVGRDEECDLVVAAIRRSPLLWVYGESGSGKSSLLRLAVVPKLLDSEDFLPIYIDSWGGDWESGPITSVNSALRRSAKTIGADVKTGEKPSVRDLTNSLKNVQAVLHRTPVLILDQFDDYIVENVGRFRPGTGGLVLSADELKNENAFWRAIALLLMRGKLHCIIVVREEQGWGQASISFIKVREFFVARLRREFLSDILTRLEEGVDNRQAGWVQLREALSEDLYDKGGILPVQMRTVLRQLPTLGHLTDTTYERAGRAIGLAARFTAEACDRAAAANATNAHQVRALLHNLVNPDDHSKTRDVSQQELQNTFAGDGSNLESILAYLKSEEIVLDRVDESGKIRWRLDHDYLALAIDELDRRDNREQRLLAEYARRFRSSKAWNKRFNLIRPQDLLRIIWGAIHGRVAIGPAWPVLAFSAGIWVVMLTLVAVLGYSATRNPVDSLTAKYVDQLDRGGNLELPEIKTWTQLASEPLVVRQQVERKLLMDRERGARLIHNGRRARMAAAAFGGLSPAGPEQFKMDLQCEKQPDNPACIFLASEFGLQAEAEARNLPEMTLLSLDRRLASDLAAYTSLVEDRCLEFVERHFYCYNYIPSIKSLRKLSPDARALLVSFYASPGEPKMSARADSPEFADSLHNSLVLKQMQLLQGSSDSNIPPPEFTNEDFAWEWSIAVDAWAHYRELHHDGVPESVGKDRMNSSLLKGHCLYGPQLVRSSDMKTAIQALAYPDCAAIVGPDLQKAIATELKGDASIGDVGRWKFLRWIHDLVIANGYDPEQFNTRLYLVRWYLSRQVRNTWATLRGGSMGAFVLRLRHEVAE